MNAGIKVNYGDVIGYKHRGNIEYAKWTTFDGQDAIELGPDLYPKPPIGTTVIMGIWKKNKFFPRKIVIIN